MSDVDLVFGEGVELRNLPYNAPVFAITPGRYYAAAFCMPIPPGREFPRGGDITSLLWRFEISADEWIFCYRFRYYQGKDAWDGKDKKSWHVGKFRGSEEVATRRVLETMKSFAAAASVYFMAEEPEVDSVVIRGDWQKFFEVVTRQNPSWMHIQASYAM